MAHITKTKTIVSTLLLIVFSGIRLGFGETYFGQNKVQFAKRDWMFIETEKFKVYFPENYESLAYFALNTLNDQYNKLKYDLGFEPQIKIPVVFYPTPNEFYETNIVWDILSEGVGGFTESLKNRVVVPFNGSYKEFDNVLRHELTHAFVFDFLYGRNRGGIFSPNRLFSLPMWFAEGLSEFESKGWDFEDDYYMRDLVINGLTEKPNELQGYKAYRQGQALVRYIAEKYGRKKLGEILAKGRMLLTINKALKAVLGLSEEELYEEWLKEAKKQYLPELKDRMFPSEFSRRLTDHKKDDGGYNFQPVLSPDGNFVAFVSDRKGYMSLYMLDIIEGKINLLIKGEQSGKYESFHPLWCRVAWMPDGEKIGFVTKRQNRDVIVIYDIKRKKEIMYYKFDYGGLYSLSFSNSADKIVFSALDGQGKDIFLLDTRSNSILKLTNDTYDDDYPVFSLNDSIIYFSSDRPTDSTYTPGLMNIFKLELSTGKITPLTRGKYSNYRPFVFGQGNNLVYITEQNGIPNLSLMELESEKTYAITNSISPIISPSASKNGDKIAFASLSEWGWDIYLMSSFPSCSLSPTSFAQAIQNEMPESSLATAPIEEKDSIQNPKPIPERYTPQFSPDLISSSLSYSNFYGLQGYTALLLSDIFGDHQFLLLTDLFNNFNNSNFLFSYGYFKPRTPFGITIFHNFTYYQDEQYRLFSDRLFGLAGFLEYPFNRFVRMESQLSFSGIERKYYEQAPETTTTNEQLSTLGGKIGIVKDNALWSTSGPILGNRSKLELELSKDIWGNSLAYASMILDHRNYFHFGKGYGIALRISFGASAGKSPKLFYLGGTDNWLNWQLGKSDIYTVRAMYFSELITPLRGYRLFELEGTKYCLFNLELRYPFVNELRLGFPLPLTIRGLRGGIFTDIAGAFNSANSFRGTKNGRLNHIKMGIGCGIRTGISFLLFSWEMGWATDLVDISAHPIHYLSLGAEF